MPSKSGRAPREPVTVLRDMEESPFSHILSALIKRMPGAYAAALVDHEGESVDYTGQADPFDIKLAAAHFRIVLGAVVFREKLGACRYVVLRASKRSLVAYALPEGYAIVVLFRRRAGFTFSFRAFDVCARALATEACWSWPEQSGWFPLDVSCDERHRPQRIQALGQAYVVDVLGAIVGLAPRERGFRVRLHSGEELSLVREPGGHWYADEPLRSDSLLPPAEDATKTADLDET